jgi:hypothetical protein
MLAGGTDALYRDVLAAGHEHYVRIEVWSGTGSPLAMLIPAADRGDPEGGLVFYSGTITATLGSRVTRNLQIGVPFDLYPADPGDLLAPFGNELRVFRGVRLGDGSAKYTWPVFRGRIRDVAQSGSSAEVLVSCADRAADVVDAEFVSPQSSQTVNTVYTEFVRLVSDAVPDAEFGTSDTFSTPVKPLTWELDRAAALDEMASSASAVWYALADGSFVMRVLPWTVASSPVITLTDKDGGTVNDWTAKRSRESIFNVVTVSGERLNGDAPVYATASDNNPASPTYVGGGFGVRSLLERLQTPSTQVAAQGAAATLLANSVAPVEAWDLTLTPDASLELGDVLSLDINGRVGVIQVVSGLTMPLDLSGDMMVSTRSLVLSKV